jgi:DNA ligase-1
MLREWLDRDPLVVDASAGDGQVTQRPGVLKRLVLDGEVCVLRQSDDGFIEDFTAAVSQVRRKDVDVAHPAYFLLDVIPWCEFSAASEIPTDQAMLKKTTFMERHQRSRTLSEFLGQQAGAGVKLVPQVRVDTLSAVEKMVGQAAEQGWEGLVFRADAPYKGNRRYVHWLPYDVVSHVWST